MILATLMQALDTTIANIALPYIQGSVSASQDQINWVLTSYIVAAAIMTPPTGFLAGRFGLKRLFLAAVAGFTVASMLCGMAPIAVADRAVPDSARHVRRGAGAAVAIRAARHLPEGTPRLRDGAVRRRGHGRPHPRSGARRLADRELHLALGVLHQPADRRPRLPRHHHLPARSPSGMPMRSSTGSASVRLSLAIGALQVLLDRGEQLDWFGSGEIWIEAIVAASAFYLFLVHTFTRTSHSCRPALFRDRNFAAGTLFIAIVGVTYFASLALHPPYLQNLMNYPIVTAGLVLGPRGIGTMAAMMLVGRLTGRVDTRLLLAIGLGLTAWAFYAMTRWTPDVSQADIIAIGVVQGAGLGFLFVPLSTVTLATLPPEHRTEGAGLYNLSRNIGSSVGISVVNAC